MTWFPTRIVAIVSVAASTVLVGWIPLAGPAGADDLPFSDPSANGYIGFCDQRGRQIRSGNMGAAPFVWTAVSSTSAPAGFAAGTGRGVLYVYQPRKEVDPGEWSGKQMTAASAYTNAAHPMAQATGADPALVDFVSVFPPKWEGLVQLRMYFTGLNRPQHTVPYPATVIRVTGNTWTVVTGGNVPCNAGKATSAETIALPSSVLQRPTARSTPGAAHPVGSSTGAKAPGGTGAGGKSSASAKPGSGADESAVAAAGTESAVDSESSGSGWGPIAWVVLAAAVVAGAVTAFVRRRRRDEPY